MLDEVIPLSMPQPHTDIELAKVCRWLVKNRRICTVTAAGEVVLERRVDQPRDATSQYRQMLRRMT